MYFADGDVAMERSARPLVMVVDEAASDDGLD